MDSFSAYKTQWGGSSSTSGRLDAQAGFAALVLDGLAGWSL